MTCRLFNYSCEINEQRKTCLSMNSDKTFFGHATLLYVCPYHFLSTTPNQSSEEESKYYSVQKHRFKLIPTNKHLNWSYDICHPHDDKQI